MIEALDQEIVVEKGTLRRELGLFSGILLVIGNIIGVGIFMTPGEVARGLPTAGWVLVAWIIGGVLTTAGALTYGELGAMFPKAGGEYVFLKEAFGSLVGFVYAITFSLIKTPGTIALLSFGFAEHLGMRSDTWQAKTFCILVVLVLTFLNCRGVKLGAGVMDFLTLCKVAAMLLLVGLGFAIGHGNAGNYSPLFAGESKVVLLAIGAALVPMAYSYSGWNATVLVAEEIRRPERVIPLSLLIGTLMTSAIYVLMNAVYLYAIPLQELVDKDKTPAAAAKTANILFAPGMDKFAAALVGLSVLGCLSATMLTNTRIMFAMSRDGLFFEWAAKIHPKYHTPNPAIWFESIVGCLYILTGNFKQILDLLDVPLVIMFAVTVCSIFVFRVRYPDQPRPYKCWGYPFVPALYIIISILMIWSAVLTNGLSGMYGIGIMLCGIPAYYLMILFKRMTGRVRGAKP